MKTLQAQNELTTFIPMDFPTYWYNNYGSGLPIVPFKGVTDRIF